MIRLLHRTPLPLPERRGRPPSYDARVTEEVVRLWEMSGRLCAKHLIPFLPTLLEALERHSELVVEASVREALLRLSAATADRLVARQRRRVGRRPFTQSGSLATLKAQIPVRTFGYWAAVEPGEVQADLVAHCGETTEGLYLTTLTVVDVATRWTELEAVWGKGQEPVRGGFHRACSRFPFPLSA